ncbi:MAG: hypothetical protein WCF22_22255, partial [Candidatus Sulfotelmatobacter sp.]
MRAPELFVLASTFLCALTAFGFPSVSPFCAVPKLAWLNGFRSDSPLNLSSVECWILDLVSPRIWLNGSHRAMRLTVLQMLYEPH